MDYSRPQLKLLLLLTAILLADLGESTFRSGGEGGLGPFDDVV